MHYTSNTQ